MSHVLLQLSILQILHVFVHAFLHYVLRKMLDKKMFVSTT